MDGTYSIRPVVLRSVPRISRSQYCIARTFQKMMVSTAVVPEGVTARRDAPMGIARFDRRPGTLRRQGSVGTCRRSAYHFAGLSRMYRRATHRWRSVRMMRS